MTKGSPGPACSTLDLSPSGATRTIAGLPKFQLGNTSDDDEVMLPNQNVATLRPCDAADPGQGWHMQGGHLLYDGRNQSAPNWQLPDCGWCLTVGPIGAHVVKKAHCCTRATCLHHPYPSAMCNDASSTVATSYQIRSDGRLLLASGRCIGAAGVTPGLTIGALDCEQNGAAFIVWKANETPPLRVEHILAPNLCLGTGVASGARPLFHCDAGRW